MGVYIKNMEMPKNGYDCPLCRHGMCRVADDNSDGICLVYGPDEEHRPSDCPLVEVLPHGRLIDGDKVLEIAMEWCPDDDGTVGKIGDLRELLDEIEAMPTIIEEEGEDENHS